MRNVKDRESAFDTVGPGYFGALGAPVTLGREILESDQPGTPRVCVINEAFAQRFFEKRNPIGLHITAIAYDKRTVYQVVGVVGNARTQSVRGVVDPRYFVAAMQAPAPPSSPTLLVRTTTETASAASAVRRAIHEVDSALDRVGRVDRGVSGASDGAGPFRRATRRGLWQRRSHACGHRVVRRSVVRGFAPFERDSDSTRARRPGTPRHRDDSRRDDVARRRRTRAWGRARLRGVALDEQPPAGVEAQDPLTLVLATGLLVLVASCAAYLPARARRAGSDEGAASGLKLIVRQST